MPSAPIPLSPSVRSAAEKLQQDHYERIAAEYDIHYNDAYSRKYMREFVFKPMFDGIELENRNVLEAMCGGGQAARFLMERNATVTGLDISEQQAGYFKLRQPGAEVICGSILDSGIPDASFDIVSVVGGIHHMPPHIDETIVEIHRILKPDGYFCFMEPHSESIAEIFRSTWYKYDPLFAKNEAAISMRKLRGTFADRFEFVRENYFGNFGYLFVLNSMVFRVPPRIKTIYSPLMLFAESVFNRIGGKPFSCFVVGQWRKIDSKTNASA